MSSSNIQSPLIVCETAYEESNYIACWLCYFYFSNFCSVFDCGYLILIYSCSTNNMKKLGSLEQLVSETA